VYTAFNSFYATGLNQAGIALQPSPDGEIGGSTGSEAFTVIDDVVVPPEYERYVILQWGDRPFPNREDYVGYNCDFNAFVPISGTDDGYLWVNHEYVSYPISKLAPETPADIANSSLPETGPLIVPGFPTSNGIELQGEFMYNQGGSVVRIRKSANGRYIPIRGGINRRIHGLSGLGINSTRTDRFQGVTAWGNKSYQQGNQDSLIGTGPVATDVFERVNADGLGSKIIGTAFNCSGGVTPWGTVMSAEENFQGSATFFVGVTEAVQPNGSQLGYTPGTTGETFGLLGEKYGYMVEIDPADPGFRPRKHTALGRYRHENVAIRADDGQRLVAYMGDDRRGGHTWKYVSDGVVRNPANKANSALFESGTLYVARFNVDGTGEWIPLRMTTATNPIPPSVLASVEIAALGSAQRNGLLPLPRRNGIAEQTVNGGQFGVTTANEVTALPGYQNKTLANFYANQGAILSDAFLAGNLAGGTPTARPEDIEISPLDPRVCFVAYTDGAAGSDGYPDSRIFQVAKLSSALDATQQSGGLYKITEDSADGTGTTFRWERFAQGGEAGQTVSTAIPSSNPIADGFGNVDNLVFDSKANLWGVTDMSTTLHNGFFVGAAGATVPGIEHARTGNVAEFVGVFGNNWMFYIPTSGPDAGEIVPFAYGPVRCEMTGPFFVGDTLILSVQHPGEDCPYSSGKTLQREIQLLALDGSVFLQSRQVPQGSNWPSNILGNTSGLPRPTVIGIRRKQPIPGGGFV
jgi:secreted PhoX family phosphatase